MERRQAEVLSLCTYHTKHCRVQKYQVTISASFLYYLSPLFTFSFFSSTRFSVSFLVSPTPNYDQVFVSPHNYYLLSRVLFSLLTCVLFLVNNLSYIEDVTFYTFNRWIILPLILFLLRGGWFNT